jgi:hypothetical protein
LISAENNNQQRSKKLKNFKRVYMCAAILCILGFNCVDSWAGDYLGDFCLGMKDYQGAIRFKMGITSIGGNHFSINGVEFLQDRSKKVMLGSAEIIDSSIVMTITVASTGVNDRGSYVESKAGVIVLDSTMKGTLSMIDTKAYTDGSDHIGDSYESLIPVSCP